jgi:hypothetical protein
MLLGLGKYEVANFGNTVCLKQNKLRVQGLMWHLGLRMEGMGYGKTKSIVDRRTMAKPFLLSVRY